MAYPAARADPIRERIVGFGRALREHHIAVGPSEIVDAVAVADALGLADRHSLREGLACAVLRRTGERAVYDDLFDVWFPAVVGHRSDAATSVPVGTDPAARRQRAAALRAELARALADHDERALDRLAAQVVDELGGRTADTASGPFSSAQALDTLNPRMAFAAALSHLRDAAVDAPGGSGDGSSGSAGDGIGAGGMPGARRFADRFAGDELREAIAAFRGRVEREVRRRNAEAVGVAAVSRAAVPAAADRTAFALAGKVEVDELRRTVDPLARKLATRLAARRRRAARGGIDLRRTLRGSLSTGGVPMRPVRKHAQPARPELVLLTDLSSSVSGFSRFTILLMQAMAAQFKRIRIFGFVNIVDELTDKVVLAAPGADLTRAFEDMSSMTRWHHYSDYGTSLADFTTHHLAAVGPRTTVLILGDARTNGTDPRYDELRRIVERARHVVWLNPEPSYAWGNGDSVAHRYAEIVDMYECRNVAQLRHFVTRLMPL